MATVEQQVRIAAGSSQDIDAVMRVMDAAFGERFGEAWTRSQLGGILPMAGVSLILAREPDNGGTIGFSLFRTVADESELLLIAVIPSNHRRGVGRMLLDDFLDRARNDGVARVHLEVRDGNSAVSLYRVAGFSPVGRRCNYYHASDGRRFDAVTLAYQL
ncbi:MAG: GNAT family N-acetyltransferase [Sphingomicrobium sp.]